MDAKLLLQAYCQGIFPMADQRGRLRWYDPDPRTILPLDTFHVPRRLARTIRNDGFSCQADDDFAAVIAACAAPARGREGTWLSSRLIAVYTELHALGFAHSIASYREGRLAGGLFGVAVGGLFTGESMFSAERDGSKVALVALVERLRRGGFTLLDTQFTTTHLAGFGAVEISRAEYKQRLAAALRIKASWD